ncbi:hypothetical protein Ddye_025410, partial [Dipteronia dyeriana]
MPEISALLFTHEARIEQHNQTEVLNVNLASGNQSFNQNNKGNGVWANQNSSGQYGGQYQNQGGRGNNHNGKE